MPRSPDFRRYRPVSRKITEISKQPRHLFYVPLPARLVGISGVWNQWWNQWGQTSFVSRYRNRQSEHTSAFRDEP
jgi:hypothetical protein